MGSAEAQEPCLPWVRMEVLWGGRLPHGRDRWMVLLPWVVSGSSFQFLWALQGLPSTVKGNDHESEKLVCTETRNSLFQLTQSPCCSDLGYSDISCGLVWSF